jgi:ABC-type branched-subunit amino acid transport system ATPase component/branched-subunit amino acid ABC-type transport system permease component
VDQYLLFMVVGLGFGCIYAAIGMGVVITYRGTGVINFATGAMAMWGAYVYDELERTGNLVLPVAVIPHKFKLGDDLPFTMSFILALLSCSLIGLLVHFLVFRPLRRAPVLAKVVASVGVLIFIQALVVMQFGSTPRAVPPILPNEVVRFAGADFSRDRLWLTLIVVIVAVAAWAYFRFTRIGLATRASAENEQAVSLARYSPQLLAGATWVLSSTVVGGLVILTAPTVILNPITYALAIVPALAAALVGRLQSIAITTAFALGLGAFQSIVTLQTSKSWWPDWAITGVSDAVPFVIIIVALYFLGSALPTRGEVQSDPLPEVIRPRTDAKLVVPVFLIGLALMILLDGSYRFGLITSLIITIIMLSLVVLTGLVGQISLAQAGIAGTAGFALSKFSEGLSIPFPISVLLAATVAAVFGVIIGIPALRVRGAQLAVITLAGAVALEKFIFRNPSFTDVSGNPIPDISIFGVNLGVREGRTIARLGFGITVLIVVTVCALLVANLARSATGRRFLAVRSNERAGASVGISVANTKLVAFGIASFLAGIGGAFIGYSRGQLSADSFATLVGLSFLAFAYLGGITSVSGAVIAGTFAPLGIGFVIFDRNIELGSSYALFAGLGLIITAIFNPEGIAGANQRNWRAIKARFVRAVDRDDHAVDDGIPAAIRAARDRPARRDVSDAPSILEARDLTVTVGGLRAVDRVNLRLREGQIVGLIGPNGAGKTTTINALTGFVESNGAIDFDGDSMAPLLAHERARRGLARTWQSLELFTDLSVEENLRVASERPSITSVLLDFVAPERDVDLGQVNWALDVVGLTPYADRRPSALPLGQQKLVGVARALAGSPKVVLLDEPAAGLDTEESRALGNELFEIVEHGVSILLIDHDMGLVLDVCDYIYVLDFGRLIAEGTPAEIRANDLVIEAYLGQGADV